MNRQNNKRSMKKKNKNSRHRKNPQPRPVFQFTEIKQNPEIQRSMRFLGALTANVPVAMGNLDLGQLMMACANGSTAGNTALAAVKLHSVSITLLPSLDEEGLFSFTWDGQSTLTANTSRIPSITRTIPYAPSNAARITFYPPEDSLASFWVDQSQFANQDILFTLLSTGGINVVMDLHYSSVVSYENPGRLYTFSTAATYTGIVCGRLGRNPATPNVPNFIFVPADLSVLNVSTVV